MIGQKLNNRYTITARLGKGAMGTVYRATDAQTGQEVALKVIASDLAVDPAMLERFKREGEALRQLKHPNIVGFTDAFEHDEHYVIVMEYVAGGSLYDLIKKGPLTIERATQIALDLCDALIRSHRLKIIHRDIKPENVLIAEDGTPKLADFGVARLSEGTRMTRSGMQVGTPYYMAPEAWEGKTLDAQADIWSLGVVLFEMLTGQVPFGGDTPHAVLNKVSNTPPPDLKKLRADVPHGLARIITRMLTRDLDQRYQTMREVAVDLERGEPATTPMAAKAKPARKKKETKKPGFVNKKTIGIAGVVILLLSVGALGLNTLIQNFPFATASTSSPEGLATSALPTSTPALAEEITDARGITMRLVPAGSFTMGSEEYDVTKPVHEVYLDAFWMDQTEVTNAMYAKCVEDGLCQEPHFAGSLTQPRYYGNSEFDNYPVIHVEWNMANIYCGWREASLPTEAQWEKAARGTDGRTYPWGESYGADHSNDINQNEGDTVAVGSYEIGKSPYGIYDMSGNVDEWVADWFSDTYYQNSPSTNPLGPETGQFRVLRGGSWNDNTQTYYRDNNGPSFSSDDVGFRCARSATPTATQNAAEVINLLSEDFEDGTADGWTVIEGEWEVVEDTPSNHVYKGVGTFWGYTIAGSDEWKNYALEVKVKGIESQNNGSNFAGIDVRVDWKGSVSCERYASRLEFTNWIGWGKYGGDCNNDWDGRFYRIEMEKWYLLRFEVLGDTLKFYVDNKLMIENTDSELKTGYIGLSVGENDTVYFDDVHVVRIGE